MDHTCVGLALLTGSGRLGAVLRLDLDQVGAFLLTVKGGPGVDDARVGINAEELGVATLILQNDVVNLGRKEFQTRLKENYASNIDKYDKY